MLCSGTATSYSAKCVGTFYVLEEMVSVVLVVSYLLEYPKLGYS
jgi:hypothetical protein